MVVTTEEGEGGLVDVVGEEKVAGGVEVATRQARQTAPQRRRDSGGTRTRIPQTTISSGRPPWRGVAPARAAFGMVAG